MSQGIEAPQRPRARAFVRHHRDFYRAIVLLGLALFAFWAAWTLPGLSGSGTVLWLSGGVLAVAAGVIIFLGLTVKNPQDYYGGAALIALALFAFWASSDLPGMRGFSFGPGTAPRLFAGVLLIFGVAITAIGLLTEGGHLEKYAARGPIFVTAGILLFAFTIRPLGLIISSFAAFLVTSLGSTETRWVEAVIAAAALTAFCTFLFPYVLNLPFQMWPWFWY
jgi:putative tricarboxylic transport membrane protein